MAHQKLQHATARSRSTLALSALALSAALTIPAAADEPRDSKITPHQVVHCMMKRLRADRTESYQTAFKTCKQALDAAPPEPRADTAMNTAASSETPRQ